MISVGQLGCGYWGPNILRALLSLPDCRVRWLADPSAARRDYVGRTFPGVPVTERAETVLLDPDVDAVVIATPAATHFELASAALERGKHVLVEKPLATTEAEASQLEALAKQRDRVLMVGHVFLYNEACRWVKRALDAGELGTLHYFQVERLNLGQVRSDVNAWWNFAPHDVSILLYLMGGALPTTVTARGLDAVQPGIEDVVFATLAWERVVAQIHVSWLSPVKSRRLTAVGSKKMIVWDDVADDKIAVYDRGIDRVPRLGEQMHYDRPDSWQLVHRTGSILLPHVELEEPLKVELRHFLECAQTGATPLTDARHGRAVVRVLEAGAASLRAEGALVRIT